MRDIEKYKELAEFVAYDKDTGIFTWKKITTNKVRNKAEAGTINNVGYRVIRFRQSKFLCHRFAWFLVHQEIPENDIDHINGNRSDNRILNLRKTTRRENLINKEHHRNGRLPGANFEKNRNKWRARCYVNKKLYSLGSFETELEAHHAYCEFVKNIKGTTCST
jgi:hypothetical protein